MPTHARFSPRLGLWSLVALGVAVGVGLWGRSTGSGLVVAVATTLAPLGALWVSALQMTVIPLVVTQLLAALVRPGSGGEVGRLGARAVALFFALLGGAAVLTLVVTPLILSGYHVPPEAAAGLRIESVPEAALAAARGGRAGFGEWLTNLVPANPFEALARGDILQVLVFTILLGLAMGQLPDASRDPLARGVRSLADAVMILVSWILWGTPVGILAILLGLTLEAGLGAMNLLVWFVVGASAILLLATLLLYPVTVAFGRTTLGRFARAVAPAQLVALGTRSSLASLPALVEGGKDHLDLSEKQTGFTLPLCVSTFKLNQGIVPLFRLLLLAHFLGIPLAAGDIAAFVVGATLLSFGVAGVPRGGGSFRTLPLYLAVGIPIEAVIILEAVETIPDFFMTLLNVTADMSVATLLSRGDRLPEMAAAAATLTVPVTSPDPATADGTLLMDPDP